MPLTLRLVGQERLVIGKCIILAPSKQMQIILQGITDLQTLDREMFLRLTAERRYIFWYHPKKYVHCREVFTITENFLLWGKEGVITCFVQAVLDFNLQYLPWERSMVEHRGEVADRHDIQQQVFEFLKKNSFSPELVEQYHKMSLPNAP
jgi:hypothetical protein